ncbi:MAG: TRAP transporter small permease subunit, partial [Deltaproteobacteria bacterium]|nr:TRAP transporter small permease subunit [Deltaproteobacteria bacterium]
CFPISLLQRQHVTIQFLGRILGDRWELSLNFFGGLLLALFFGLVAWQFTVYTLELQNVGEHTWVVQIPLAPWWWITTLVVW